MNLFDKISEDIKAAMIAKDAERLQALRGVKSALLLAKTSEGTKGELTEEASLKVLQKEVKQRKDSAEIYRTQGRADLAQIEEKEASVIMEYLPKMLTEEELTPILEEIIARLGASKPADMGKVMGVANKELQGKAEGRLISAIVKNKLNQN